MAPAAPSLTNELRLHYRCDFEVGGAMSTPETFAALIREIRQWLTDTRKIPKQAVAGAWFYNDGEWLSSGRDPSSVRTSRFEAGECRASWTVRYEHLSESKYEQKPPADRFRVWRTDIALNCDGERNVR